MKNLWNKWTGIALVKRIVVGLTMIPAMQMYKIAFGDGKFGYASALGVVLFVVIILMTLLTRHFFREED